MKEADLSKTFLEIFFHRPVLFVPRHLPASFQIMLWIPVPIALAVLAQLGRLYWFSIKRAVGPFLDHYNQQRQLLASFIPQSSKAGSTNLTIELDCFILRSVRELRDARREIGKENETKGRVTHIPNKLTGTQLQQECESEGREESKRSGRT
ncbi:hypothetical protein C8R45DRAFT_921971 [Mycena sanguinolenta]|nr:hypothetical protein C8R45DRAFT_921971 [Mycena sanguinolenta]